MTSRFAGRLGIAYPIVQAPMAGGGDTPELVAAVSSAGGLGCFGASYSQPKRILEYCARVRSLCDRPFGVNLFAPGMDVPEMEASDRQRAVDALAPYFAELDIEPPQSLAPPPYSFEEQFEACLETGAAVLSFTFGALPARFVEKAKAKGMFLAGTATTVEEATVLESSGVDAVIAQGTEAGGHRGTFLGGFDSSLVGTMALVPQVCDAVSVPVIASGGIMDGRGVAAALCLGAAAVQLGTAFLACEEAGVPACYKDALLHAREDQLVLTSAFSGRPARGIDNRFTSRMREYSGTGTILPFPLQNALTRPIRAEASRRGDAGLLSLWAGQGVRMAKRQSARDLMARLTGAVGPMLVEAQEAFKDAHRSEEELSQA